MFLTFILYSLITAQSVQSPGQLFDFSKLNFDQVQRYYACERYQSLIHKASQKYGVSEKLITEVIRVESCFEWDVISHKGAIGLMQLMPETAKWLKVPVESLFSAEVNIDTGTKLLRYLCKKYKGNLKLVLAAYNAGEGSIHKYKGVPPFKETQYFVTTILERL